MIPLRDNIPSRTFPFITVALIALNCFIFLYEVSRGHEQARALIAVNGFIPQRIFQPLGLTEKFMPLLTSLFLHGGLMHLGGNMLFLWIFGDNVEDKMGHIKFLFFYLLTGIIATLAHTLTALHSSVPVIGASGAISGVLGAYFFLFPNAEVLTYIPLLWRSVEINASFFIGFWFIGQLFLGVSSLGLGHSTGVAFWAHIGGFAAGLLLVRSFGRRRVRRKYPFDF